MGVFNWIFIFIMVIGFIMIIVSILNINKYNNATPISNIDDYIKKMKNTIDQADLAIDDLNLMSEEIFKRFDKKQKQLLFLYETKKKKKNVSNNKFDIKIGEDTLNLNTKQKYTSSLHPMASKINELYEQNMSVSEIAKTLNMGKGEVELIINLGKDSL